MPRRTRDQPSETERLRLRDTLTTLLDNPDPSLLPPRSGARVLHRLNRTEYNNTVRELLGITTRLADRFPADGGGGGGFDNNADTLFVPRRSWMEKYLPRRRTFSRRRPRTVLWIARVPRVSERSRRRRAISRFARRAFRRPVSPDSGSTCGSISPHATRAVPSTRRVPRPPGPSWCRRFSVSRGTGTPSGAPWRLDDF